MLSFDRPYTNMTHSHKHTHMLRELLPLLQPIAFKIPAHLGMVSFVLKSSGSHVLALLLPALLLAVRLRS